MNNLKFRVWELPSKKFWYDMDDLFKNPSVIPSKIFNGEDGLLFINQWTGLQDKNGLDIYEGDYLSFEIPKITHGPEKEFIADAEVWYDVGTASWQLGKFINKNCSPPHEWSYDLSWPLDKKTLLVTGNIYEKNLTI